jgi:hypothetical protein
LGNKRPKEYINSLMFSISVEENNLMLCLLYVVRPGRLRKRLHLDQCTVVRLNRSRLLAALEEAARG